jgi:hypothetical protein
MENWRYRSPQLLTSTENRNEWFASRSGHFNPWTHQPKRCLCIGDWINPRDVWILWRRQKSVPCLESNSDIRVVQTFPRHYTDSAYPIECKALGTGKGFYFVTAYVLAFSSNKSLGQTEQTPLSEEKGTSNLEMISHFLQVWRFINRWSYDPAPDWSLLSGTPE